MSEKKILAEFIGDVEGRARAFAGLIVARQYFTAGVVRRVYLDLIDYCNIYLYLLYRLKAGNGSWITVLSVPYRPPCNLHACARERV